ncbi:uncharacterized protein LOC112340825 [Selaginella moellendorffii]|uniref:uncharacterized protein LOC112340825 n=1 Tax=Selaginella moellendorffii TaxID=88036 RepID=UPI000D1C4D46|nr:uncharacterized protein LOC112340825 [Selaginella moellendorffii]|eukprot:XP_024515671.1 uncharacterized protein LOC112340825 [Selaginella moellendorffii]
MALNLLKIMAAVLAVITILITQVDANGRLDVYDLPGCQDPGTSYTAKLNPCFSTCVATPLYYRFTYSGQAGILFSLPDCLGTSTIVRSNVSLCDATEVRLAQSVRLTCIP